MSNVDALTLVFIVVAGLSALCWVLSRFTRDTSWVDRAWSIVPVVYVWIFTICAMVSGIEFGRPLLMAILVTLWGVRLSYNFARKGGYSGMEDYRWAVLRGRMRPWLFQLFNLFFIIGFQMVLLVLITLPTHFVISHPSPLNFTDALVAALFLAALLGETVADQQQWNFHQRKQRAGGTLEPGFLWNGMFRYSRHPNFFFEQVQWWVFYLFTIVAASSLDLAIWGGALNWTLAGAALLTALFIGSTIFTESISAAKYPAYAHYRRATSMLIPWWPKRKG